VSERSPYLRFLAVVVGTALALRIAWLLIRPLLPVIAGALALYVVWQLFRWYHGSL
jgi:predicted PurR-regulated permease PerM